MLFHSLRAFCKAPGGAGSIWKYLEALARVTGVSERFAYGFRTELHFADSACCLSVEPYETISYPHLCSQFGVEVFLVAYSGCE
jgi:hypothetical protein